MADLTVPLSSSLPPDVLKALMDKYPQLAQQASSAEEIVKAASKPGTASTAEEAAQVFKNAAPNGPGSAAESAGVFEAGGEIGAPGVEAGKELVPLGERGLVPTAAAEGAGALEKGAIAMGQGAGDQLPAVIERAGLPALAEGTGAVAARGLGRLASKAIPVVGQAAMVADAIHGKLADPNDFQGTPVPGHPGYLAKGPDIVKDPGIPDEDRASAGTSLFDRISGAIKRHTPEMTAPDVTRAPAGPATADAETSDATPAKPGMNPLLQRYLMERGDMFEAQRAANHNQTAADIAQFGTQMAHAIAGAPGQADLSAVKALRDSANAPVENLQTAQSYHTKGVQAQVAEQQAKTLAEENDPNSVQSQRTRAAYAPLLRMTNLDPKSIEGLSAADIKATVEKPLEVSAKIQELKEAAQLRRTIANQTYQDKIRHQDEQENAVIGTKLNAMTASSRSSLGLASKAKMQAARLLEIVNDPSATEQDLNSAYADLNGIVSGNSTLSGTEHQAYHNLQTQMAAGIAYITSQPTAPNIPQVKQHVADMAKKMTVISDQIINHNTKSIQAGHAGWISRHPDLWQNHLDVQNASMELGSTPAGATPNPAPSAQTPKSAAHPIGSIRQGTDGFTYKKTEKGWERQAPGSQ